MQNLRQRISRTSTSNTLMDSQEYMRIPIKYTPQEIVDEYNILPLINNMYVYTKITRGLYRLPQSGLLANKLLTKLLTNYGFSQTKHTPVMWHHAIQTIKLCNSCRIFWHWIQKQEGHNLPDIFTQRTPWGSFWRLGWNIIFQYFAKLGLQTSKCQSQYAGLQNKSCTIFNIKANKTSESTTQTYKTNPCVQNIIFQKSDDGPKLK